MILLVVDLLNEYKMFIEQTVFGWRMVKKFIIFGNINYGSWGGVRQYAK